MKENKKQDYIRIPEDFFENEKIAALMEHENGVDYAILFLFLCTKTIDTNGELAWYLSSGQIIPYDAYDIAEDYRHLTKDNVVAALDLFEKLGLLYFKENGVLKIANYEQFI